MKNATLLFLALGKRTLNLGQGHSEAHRVQIWAMPWLAVCSRRRRGVVEMDEVPANSSQSLIPPR